MPNPKKKKTNKYNLIKIIHNHRFKVHTKMKKQNLARILINIL